MSLEVEIEKELAFAEKNMSVSADNATSSEVKVEILPSDSANGMSEAVTTGDELPGSSGASSA